ncbi:MAG: response regulator [Edaphobacter sp.]|uniref:response regulator n=1 Tax=Edaphobacter sp. TaxID=1934404 RepID=UPI00239D68FC|nr:response regulator [Edaphobacter sp.]MDE1178313.1 response regulator [Edaphobacter sp.]
MDEWTGQGGGVSAGTRNVRVLLLDDEPANLHLRTAILRQHGYHCIPAATIDEAIEVFDQIDIAVLDYHLGSGKFGTEVAYALRRSRPAVPIIILSATLERHFGGAEDMHLLKGYSSVEDLLSALSALEAKRRGVPVVVDARDFFYSRIAMAIGSDVLVQIFDHTGIWMHCNDAAAEYLGQPRDWFPGRCVFDEMPTLMRDWRDVLRTVSHTRETYIDRTRRGLLALPKTGELNVTWSVLAFPITLHDDRSGVVLTARILERNNGLFS